MDIMLPECAFECCSSPNMIFSKIILPARVAEHEAWDLGFFFGLRTGLTCKYRNLLLCKKLPFAQRQTRWHSSLLHRNTAAFCVLGWGYCGRLIQGMFFCFAFFFFFSTLIPVLSCSLLSLCGRGSSAFCVATVLNIEHSRRRDRPT